jgi:hypothetical protein
MTAEQITPADDDAAAETSESISNDASTSETVEPELDLGLDVPDGLDAAHESLARSLITLGFVAFDGQGADDNTSSGILVSQELRKHFRRDAYVGIRDDEQDITFLARVV